MTRAVPAHGRPLRLESTVDTLSRPLSHLSALQAAVSDICTAALMKLREGRVRGVVELESGAAKSRALLALQRAKHTFVRPVQREQPAADEPTSKLISLAQPTRSATSLPLLDWLRDRRWHPKETDKPAARNRCPKSSSRLRPKSPPSPVRSRLSLVMEFQADHMLFHSHTTARRTRTSLQTEDEARQVVCVEQAETSPGRGGA